MATVNPRKYLLALCALVTCQQTVGMASYVQQAWNEATATTGRAIITALATVCIANELYRFASLSIKRKALEQARATQIAVCHEDAHARKPYATLFAHGLAATQEQGTAYERALKINHAVHTFNFVDAGTEKMKMRQCGLAQEHDIQQLKAQIDAHADKNLVLFGLSRGASTSISTMAFHKPANVKALILESPFDDMRSVAAHKASYAAWIPGVTTLGNILLSCVAFPNYSTGALAPIDLVTHIPDDVSVLFICSQQDTLIPASSTKRLYTTLKEHRNSKGIKNNVYLVETEQGKHAGILASNRELYQKIVHAFYRKAGLPQSAYYEGSAHEGEAFLTQP